MSEDKDKKPGPLAPYLTAAKILAILVGIGVSLWQAQSAMTKADDTAKKAKSVTNSNAAELETVITLLLKNDQKLSSEVGYLRGMLSSMGIGMAQPARVMVESYKPKARARPQARTKRAPASKTHIARLMSDETKPAPKPKPKPVLKPKPAPVKFKLKRMVQEQVQRQSED
jgi:hypothetical protein